jgi:hypothetical protein
MKLASMRAKEIEVWIKDHPHEKSDYEKVDVELEGKIRYLDVWRLPIRLLVFNIRNGRFAAELMAKERELKRKLDASKPADALIIRDLLLKQNESETEALRENLRLHGQLKPGIITFDGAVINANRRTAILDTLREETSDAKFEYLRAAILPPTVSEKDLWRIEAGIQFAKDFIEPYGPVNELLKLREGRQQGLSAKDISATLLGRFSDKQVEEKLGILKQIESYLEFIGKPHQYDEVEGDVEKFNSLVKNVLQPLRRDGVSNQELHKLNMIAFSLIKSGEKDIRHWEIRRLREIAELDKAKSQVVGAYNVKEPTKTATKTLVDAFWNAVELVDDKKDQEQPEKLLRRALTAVQSINPKNKKLKDPAVKKLLNELTDEVEKLVSQANKVK